MDQPSNFRTKHKEYTTSWLKQIAKHALQNFAITLNIDNITEMLRLLVCGTNGSHTSNRNISVIFTMLRVIAKFCNACFAICLRSEITLNVISLWKVHAKKK